MQVFIPTFSLSTPVMYIPITRVALGESPKYDPREKRGKEVLGVAHRRVGHSITPPHPASSPVLQDVGCTRQGHSPLQSSNVQRRPGRHQSCGQVGDHMHITLQSPDLGDIIAPWPLIRDDVIACRHASYSVPIYRASTDQEPSGITSCTLNHCLN